MEPDETLCVEPAEEDDEDMEEDDGGLEEQEEEPSEGEKRKTKAPPPRGRSGSGRPRRATAGKSKFSLFMKENYYNYDFILEMSAYVDFSSSEESDHKVVPAKRRRNEESESGSDVSCF